MITEDVLRGYDALVATRPGLERTGATMLGRLEELKPWLDRSGDDVASLKPKTTRRSRP